MSASPAFPLLDPHSKSSISNSSSFIPHPINTPPSQTPPLKAAMEDQEATLDLAHLSLRPLQLSDTDDFMVWATDEKVAKFCTWEPYKSKDEAVKFIQNVTTKFLWCRAICLDDRAIGSVSVRSYSGDDDCRVKSAELGYVLGSKYWGKGIATKVVKQVVEMAFADLPYLERLEALVDVENVASQRVLEKAGFQREGILRKFLFMKGKSRDMIMFSVLSDDIQA